MDKFKLNISLLPKGAWNNDFSKTLATKDWDKLRAYCYKKYDYKCAICGIKTNNLHAHEEWDFDIKNKTQILVNIIALCPKCHGVKHMQNTQRIGYEQNAKKHFCEINHCNMIDFANHYFVELIKFEERNQIFRWKIIADLSKFGGKNIFWKNKYLPMIENPYYNVDFSKQNKEEIFADYNNDKQIDFIKIPKIRFIDVNNYVGKITIIADDTTKIECISNNILIDKRFNFFNKFVAVFSVENLETSFIEFLFYNKNTLLKSKKFKLYSSY